MTFHLKTKYVDEKVRTRVREYPNGWTALEILSMSGEPLYTASVNIADWGISKPEKNQIWIKTWSENEGLAEALEEAGIVQLTQYKAQGPYDSVAQLAILSEGVRQ